jgi:hypothetical protein
MGFSIEPDEGTLHLDPLPLTFIVTPANAGIQLHALRRPKLDPDFRQGDE